MILNKTKLFFVLYLFMHLLVCQAGTEGDSIKLHPLYVGVTGGYGATTWSGLVPLDLSDEDEQNFAMRLSTPIDAREGGGLWGVFAGYEFIPSFALEVSYLHYQDATVIFDEISNFTYDNDGLTEFVTKTETISLSGKFMVFIPRTKVRVYSSIGGAGLHRNDILTDAWRYTPIFGVGFNTNFGQHVMAEIGANFTVGYGEAQLNPSDVYFPFLYAGFARLAYRF